MKVSCRESLDQLEQVTREDITAVILAKNEAHQLHEAIQGVLWANEVLVIVDSSSTDGSEASALGLAPNVRVLVHSFGGFSNQRNWAIDQVSSPWVFMLDADERPSPDLIQNIAKVLEEGASHDAYRVYRRNYILGRFLRHGGQAHDSVIRLFRSTLRYQPRLVHEEVEGFNRIGTLEGWLDHYTFHDWKQYIGKMHSYVLLAGQQAWQDGVQCRLSTILGRPLARFLKQYVMRGGFLDGMPGLIYSCLASYSVFLKYAVLWDLIHRSSGQGLPS